MADKKCPYCGSDNMELFTPQVITPDLNVKGEFGSEIYECKDCYMAFKILVD